MGKKHQLNPLGEMGESNLSGLTMVASFSPSRGG